MLVIPKDNIPLYGKTNPHNAKRTNMTIDVQPTEVKSATTIDSVIMEYRQAEELYIFIRDNGEQSVYFTPSTLSEFLPYMTVSEFIESDTLKQGSRWLHSVSSWEAGKHPLWYAGERYKPNTEWMRGAEWFSIAQSLRESYAKNSAKCEIKQSRNKLDNPWKFIVIKKAQ